MGATMTLDMMIQLIDTFFAIMALPTMIATIIMAPRVIKEAKRYFKALKESRAGR